MKVTALIATVGLLALPGLAHAAGTVEINFNEVQDGTVINTTYSSLGVTFAGETSINHDIQATTDYGAFSTNALDATGGVVDVFLDPAEFAYGLDSFHVTSVADPAGYGSTSTSFNFYDAKGGLVYSLDQFDQTTTKQVALGKLAGVSMIVLPADAYYDDFSFQAAAAPVPEAGTAISFGALLTLGGLAILRRKRTAGKLSPEKNLTPRRT